MMLSKITVKYLTSKDYDMCSEIVGESDLLLEELKSKGYKICVLINNRPIFIFICAYGSKKDHGYIGELWTDGSKISKRILSMQIKMFNKIHEGWNIYYHSIVADKFKRHSKFIKNNMYQYTGVLNVK